MTHRAHPPLSAIRRRREGPCRLHPAFAALAVWTALVDGGPRTWHPSPRVGGPPGPSRSPEEIERPISPRLRIFSRADRHDQRKAKRRRRTRGARRVLYDKAEWGEDDDDVDWAARSEDGDAENFRGEGSDTVSVEPVAESDGIEGERDSGEEGVEPDEVGGGKPQKSDREEGIIYSESVGSKEADSLSESSRSPTPPHPAKNTANTSIIEDAENEKMVNQNDNTSKGKEGGIEGNGSTILPIVNTTNTTHINIDNNNDGKKKKHKDLSSMTAANANVVEDYSPPADTIFDDLLRGFGFALLFTLLLFCSYRCCAYVCVRCGLFPDSRVIEARWRRWQMLKKRSYRQVDQYSDNPDIPPLDTRLWGKWMEERNVDDDGYYYANVGDVGVGGVWDNNPDDEWENEEEGIPEGAVEFAGEINAELEMAAFWKTNKGELEYGEGDALEDKSHDSRLFDSNDGGGGIEKEADEFFKGRSKDEEKGKSGKDDRAKGGGAPDRSQKDDPGTNGKKLAIASNQQAPPSPVDDAERPQNVSDDVSDDSFFGALQKSSGKKCLRDDSGSDSPFSEKDFVDAVDLRDVDRSGTNEDSGRNGGDSRRDRLGFSSSIIVDDRGYDEETDLLGLRSDSPPPLDLKEIEKKAMESIENAKLY